MNGAITELSAKIIRSAKISKRKIIGPSQYLFLNRINCQNSLKIKKREKKFITSSYSVILSPTGEESAFFGCFASLSMTLLYHPVILSSAEGGTKNFVFFNFRFFASLRMTIFVTRHLIQRAKNLYSSKLKSFHSGLVDSIKLIFLLLNHPLICFSLAIALLTPSDIS